MAQQQILLILSAIVLLVSVQKLESSPSDLCGCCYPQPSCTPPVSYVPVPQPLPIKVQVPKPVVPPPSVTIPNIILALLPPTAKTTSSAPKSTTSAQSPASSGSFYPSPQPIMVPFPQPQPYIVPVQECGCFR